MCYFELGFPNSNQNQQGGEKTTTNHQISAKNKLGETAKGFGLQTTWDALDLLGEAQSGERGEVFEVNCWRGDG